MTDYSKALDRQDEFYRENDRTLVAGPESPDDLGWTTEDFVTDQLTHQSWRPESETRWLVNHMQCAGEPYCIECHDWHEPDEPHSMCD